MGRSLKYEIPGPDWRRSALDVGAHGLVGLFADVPRDESGASSDPSPDGHTSQSSPDIVLEIGFGRGEFLLDLAAKSPETAFLGVEVSFKRVLKLARKLAVSGLTNVRVLEGRAEAVVRDLIPPASLSEVWINFSDPWPKARHAQRRLIQPPFVRRLAGCLRPGAMLHVATDHFPYAEHIDEVLSAEPALACTHAPEPWLPEIPGRMHTGYEADWREQGRSLHFFEYRRIEAAGDPGEPAA